MKYPQFTPKAGDKYECLRRGCLRFLKGDQITVANVVDGAKGFVAMIPEGKPHVRLMPTTKIWKKV